MNTPYDLKAFGSGVVYVKPIDVADLPDDLRAQAGELTQLFALHDAEGTQLALVANRRLAYHLAREHDMVPMAVH